MKSAVRVETEAQGVAKLLHDEITAIPEVKPVTTETDELDGRTQARHRSRSEAAAHMVAIVRPSRRTSCTIP